MDHVARPFARCGGRVVRARAARPRPAGGAGGLPAMMRASHRQPGFVAARRHRLSGIALALFLPAHFLPLGLALRGADALDSFLAITRHPLAKTLELGLVVALALHMALGLRVL